MLSEVMADLALTLALPPLVSRSRVVTVGLRRVLASLLITVVIVGAVAFVGNSSQEILRTSGDVNHPVSTPTVTTSAVTAPTVITYGWSWWPLGLKTVYSDQTETVELW